MPANEQCKSEAEEVTDAELQQPQHTQCDHISVVVLHLVVNDDSEKCHERDNDRRDESCEQFLREALVVNAQVVAGQIVNNQTSYRIEQQRQVEVKRRYEDCIHAKHFAFIDEPAEQQKRQPNEFGGENVKKYIA